MRNLIVGFVAGVVAATLVLVSFSSAFRQSSEHRLIEDWRKIRPGMRIAEVQQVLGEPSGQFPLGQPYPEWGGCSVPKDFYLKRGLMTYVVPLLAPQVLLIYYDEDDRVVFVSSVPT